MRQQAKQPPDGRRFERPANRDPLPIELQRDGGGDESQGDRGEESQVVQPAAGLGGIPGHQEVSSDAVQSGDAHGRHHHGDDADQGRAPDLAPQGMVEREGRGADERRDEPRSRTCLPRRGEPPCRCERPDEEDQVGCRVGRRGGNGVSAPEVADVPGRVECQRHHRRERNEGRPAGLHGDGQHQHQVETHQRE